MIVAAEVKISGTRQAVWSAVTDIAHSAAFIRGIESIEMVDRPIAGLLGLRWLETRILFGEAATVEKRITEVIPNESYTTRAESDGYIFNTTLRLSDGEDGVKVTSSHETIPQSIKAKIMAVPMRLFFQGVVRKAILQDLHDIKSAVEKR